MASILSHASAKQVIVVRYVQRILMIVKVLRSFTLISRDGCNHVKREMFSSCLGNPCKNGGQCQDGINQYQCLCAVGYTGHDCEKEIDECLLSPCLNNATCRDMIGNFSCNCSLGFEGKKMCYISYLAISHSLFTSTCRG